MDAVNPVINAFLAVTAEQARKAAKAAEKKLMSSADLSPLFGVPLTVKGLTDTAGVRTTYGCVLYAEHVPADDAIALSCDM